MSDSDYDYELKAIPNHIFDTRWRVKLYHLNSSGQWDDMGTGHIIINQEVINSINKGGRNIS